MSLLEVAPAPPQRQLEDFCGDGEARVADFFAVWNEDLPAAHREANDKMCNEFITVYGRTRFKPWFKLKSNKVDEVIAKAFHSSSSREAGDGWREAIEDLAGFKFCKPEAPESAELVLLSHKRTREEADEGVKPSDKKLCTVGSRLFAKGAMADEELPEQCYSVIETADPLVTTITEQEIGAFTDEVLEYCAGKHGSWAIGKALCRMYGKQASKRLPNLPDRGETLGRQRQWGRIIHDKSKNRRYVRGPRCPARLARTLALCL